ncbi:MAG TPA: hypothetical protein VNA20_10115 [Frankiaceae bacterium]|nr:hypothetical protein [Frankiaceae bacterium]
MLRRVLVVLAVVLGAATVPGEATAPAAATPATPARTVPGRTALAPLDDGAEWLHATREAVAGSGRAPKALTPPNGAEPAAIGDERDRRVMFVGDDYDGDRVADLLLLRSVFTEGPFANYDAFTEITVYSGRTGAYRWRRRFEDVASPLLYLARVGRGGAPGIVLVNLSLVPGQAASLLDPVSLLFPQQHRRLRLIGLTNRGRTGYDTTVTTEDGKGDIQWGGTFDAYPGNGTEALIGRVKPFVPGLVYAYPMTVDGYDGTVRAVRPSALVTAGKVAYLAAGDIDRDRRDDIVEVRWLISTLGSVAALSVVEERTLWTKDAVTVGYYVSVGGTADISGSSARDVVLNVDTQTTSVTIAGLPPDDVPLLPRYGVRGMLFDGATGEVRWDRLDGEYGWHEPWGDLDGNGKHDVLAVSEFQGERDGIRMTAVTGTGKELYRREVTVPAAPGGDLRYVWAFWLRAGDLDGDRSEDLVFYVGSEAPAVSNQTGGLFLVRRNRPVITDDYPLGGTVDGGTDERVRGTWSRTAASFTVRDGWQGPAYWTVRANATIPNPLDGASWGLGALPGARGKCDGAILYGFSGSGAWVQVLDGATGRARWSKTYRGTRPPTTVQVSGRRATCR